MKTLTGVIALMFALILGASNVVLAAEKPAVLPPPEALKNDPCGEIKDLQKKKACKEAEIKKEQEKAKKK